MATVQAGTTTPTSLPYALQFLPGSGGSGGMAAADVATIANAIRNDQGNGLPIMPGCWDSNGLLFIPNRGILKVLPGDWVAVDNNGWPILLSKQTTVAANTVWQGA